MKKTLNVFISTENLTQDNLNTLAELEEKGFIVNGKIEYDESEEATVMGILKRDNNTELNKVEL